MVYRVYRRIGGLEEDIAKATDTSVRTVAETVKVLLEHNIVRKKRGTKGLLFLNPSVVFKGSRGGRMKVLLEYRDLQQKDLFDDEQKDLVSDNVIDIREVA